MLTLKMILENREDVVRRLEKKHFAAAAEMIDNVIAADARRRAAQQESDAMQAQMNQYSKSIGGLMKEGKKAEAEAAKAEVAQLKEKSAELKSAMEEVAGTSDGLKSKFNDLLFLINKFYI